MDLYFFVLWFVFLRYHHINISLDSLSIYILLPKYSLVSKLSIRIKNDVKLNMNMTILNCVLIVTDSNKCFKVIIEEQYMKISKEPNAIALSVTGKCISIFILWNKLSICNKNLCNHPAVYFALWCQCKTYCIVNVNLKISQNLL